MPNNTTKRHKNRARKSTPLRAWLSMMMKKLTPKSSANIAYALPPNKKKDQVLMGPGSGLYQYSSKYSTM
jgi:hypothetical protein